MFINGNISNMKEIIVVWFTLSELLVVRSLDNSIRAQMLERFNCLAKYIERRWSNLDGKKSTATKTWKGLSDFNNFPTL